MTRTHIFHPRVMRSIIKNSGLGPACSIFAVAFVACAIVVKVFDPDIAHFGDALWYCFEAVTTIGFGDVIVTSAVARVCTVILSVMSIFLIAVLTAAVVNYTTEIVKMRRNESVALFLDKLEHLPDLSHDELVEVSEQVKKLKLSAR